MLYDIDNKNAHKHLPEQLLPYGGVNLVEAGFGIKSGTLVLLTLNASGVSSVGMIRAPAKILTYTEISVPLLVRAPARILSYTVTSINKLLHAPARTLPTSGGNSPSIVRSPLHILTTTGISSSSIVRAPLKLLVYVVSSIPSLVRNPTRNLKVMGTSIATLIRLPSRILATAGNSNSSLIRSVSRTITTSATSSASVARSVVHSLAANGVSAATLTRSIMIALGGTGVSSTSLIRKPMTTIGAIDTTGLADGIIRGGLVHFDPITTVVYVDRPDGRLGNIRGHIRDNSLGVSLGDPTFDRLDVVYMISPAPWITPPDSEPSPPGFDTVQVEGIPSASPVLPGSLYAPGNPYASVGYDGTAYFAALYSYRVPAGATSSSQFDTLTDRRTIVPDSVNSRGAVSFSSLLRTPTTTLTASGTGIPILERIPGIMLSAVQVGIATAIFVPVVGGLILFTTAGHAVSLIRKPMTFLRVTATNSPTINRAALKVLRATGISSPTMARAASRTFKATTTPVAALRKIAARILGTANATGTPVLSLTKINHFSMTGVGHGTASMLRSLTHHFSAVAHPLPLIRRIVSKTLSVSRTANPDMHVGGAKTLTLDSLPTGIATIVRTPIRTISAVGTGLASLLSHIFPFVAHLFSIVGIHTRFEVEGYKVFDLSNMRTRFAQVGYKVYDIRKVFKRWGQE
jgi:hypothetical protein